MSTDHSAQRFVDRLKSHLSPVELKQSQRYFKTGPGEYGEGDVFIGVRNGTIFALAKEFLEMPPKEIEKLLDSPVHEVRVGAVSIMDWQARSKKTSTSRRKDLYDLYIRRHDIINSWDLVDRSAPYVVGGYLSNKPRDILYKLARSKDIWKRRTAIVSTYYFIRQGDVDDTFRIAEILVNDDQDLINKEGVLISIGEFDAVLAACYNRVVIHLSATMGNSRPSLGRNSRAKGFCLH